MKLRKFGRVAVVGLAIAAVLGMSACGSDDKPVRKTASAASATSAATVQPPTVEQLRGYLTTALDPAVPVADKTKLVQGFESDPATIDALAKQVRDNNVKIAVTGVTPDTAGGPSAIAIGTATLSNGQTNPANVAFVYENGQWKVEKGAACGLLKILQIKSAVCPA